MKCSPISTAALAFALTLSLAACNRHGSDGEPSQMKPGSSATTPAPAGSVPTPGTTTAHPAS
jgi:hypothetical protein